MLSQVEAAVSAVENYQHFNSELSCVHQPIRSSVLGLLVVSSLLAVAMSRGDKQWQDRRGFQHEQHCKAGLSKLLADCCILSFSGCERVHNRQRDTSCLKLCSCVSVPRAAVHILGTHVYAPS